MQIILGKMYDYECEKIPKGEKNRNFKISRESLSEDTYT